MSSGNKNHKSKILVREIETERQMQRDRETETECQRSADRLPPKSNEWFTLNKWANFEVSKIIP